MGYSIQNFKDGNPLHDSHLRNIENAIITNENSIKALSSKINNISGGVGNSSSSTASFMLPNLIDISIYSGGAIACIGDSITEGVGSNTNTYAYQLGEALGMTVTNLGTSGTVLCTGGNRKCQISVLTEDNCKDKDIVTILLGANDWDQAKIDDPTKGTYYTLGTIDSEDTSCIYGAMKMWCDKIMELKQTESCAKTKFFFMTPIITSWNSSVTKTKNWDQNKTNIHGFKLRDLCQAIIDVCALYQLPVIDLNLYSGIYHNSEEDTNANTYSSDGIHIRNTGHTLITEAIIRALTQNPVYKPYKESVYYILDYISKQLKTELSYPTSVGNAVQADVALTGINLSLASTEVNAGESVVITATLVPSNTTQTNIVWSTSDSTIATVNDGVVLGISEGNVVITCKSTDNTSILATTNVKVNPPASTDLTAINISGSTEVRVGNTLSLAATLVPSTTTQTNVEWSSDNTNVATVTGDGLNATVRGVSVGQAHITCKSIDNTSISKQCFITVNEE